MGILGEGDVTFMEYTLQYIRNSAIEDDRIGYEYSSDMVVWKSAVKGVDYDEIVLDNLNETESVTVKFTNMTDTRFFVRMHVRLD